MKELGCYILFLGGSDFARGKESFYFSRFFFFFKYFFASLPWTLVPEPTSLLNPSMIFFIALHATFFQMQGQSISLF